MKTKFLFASLPLSIFIISILCTIVVIGVYYRTTISNLISYQYWRFSNQFALQVGYVENQGASIYYETSGQGEPLVLLHGGLLSLDVFFSQIPQLARERRVVAIDLRGQGRSSMGSNEFTYRLLATDVIAVLNALNIESADFIGWSDGGIIGLIVGLDYPERIRRLVSIGANFQPEGLTDATIDLIETSNPDASVWAKLMYRLRSPHPDRWQELWQRVNTMWLTRPNLSFADLERIHTPTLLVVGENDNVELAHTHELAAGLVAAELIVIPDGSHNLLMERPAELLKISREFLLQGK